MIKKTVKKLLQEYLCDHNLVQWMAYSSGIYRLFCVECGKYLGFETYGPGDMKPFILKIIMNINRE